MSSAPDLDKAREAAGMLTANLVEGYRITEALAHLILKQRAEEAERSAIDMEMQYPSDILRERAADLRRQTVEGGGQ